MIQRFATPLVAAVLLLASTGACLAEGAQVPSLVVLRANAAFENQWWQDEGAELAREVFVAAFEKDGPYRLLAGDEYADGLRDQQIWLGGELSPANAIRLGRVLGVDYVLSGTLEEFGASRRRPTGRPGKRGKLGLTRTFVARFTARVFDAASGRVIWVNAGSGQGERPKARKRNEEGEDPGAEAAENRRLFDEALRPVLEQLATELATAPLAMPREAEASTQADD